MYEVSILVFSNSWVAFFPEHVDLCSNEYCILSLCTLRHCCLFHKLTMKSEILCHPSLVFISPDYLFYHRWFISSRLLFFLVKILQMMIDGTFGIVAPLIVPLLLCLQLTIDPEGPVSIHGNHIFGLFQCFGVDLLRHLSYIILTMTPINLLSLHSSISNQN